MANVKDISHYSEHCVSPKMDTQHAISSSDMLKETLRPIWKPNDIIKMFHEERGKIEQRGRECKNLLAETDSILNEAFVLRDLYSYISPKTSQLHSECKNIIQERNDLRESFEKINYNLSKQEELRSIFKRMPEIKNHVSSILNNVSHTFHNQIKQQESNTNKATDITPLDEYYGRFFVECRRVRELTSQLESCLTCANTDELTIYLEEIYRLYIDIREQLMQPVFARNLQKLITKSNRNYCDLLQQSCTSLVRIMRNEIQLFQQIFPTQSTNQLNQGSSPPPAGSPVSVKEQDRASEAHKQSTKKPTSTSSSSSEYLRETSTNKRQALSELLELLSKTFYEHLRPVVIHINHLETLAELYKLINETIRLEFNDPCFQSTINTLAGDVQERMIFRTEVFIQESICDYQPSQGDLAYPEKFDLVPNGELNDYQSMWYPTVQRTVLALLYLHRVFDSLTFRELAHELVLACYKSLDDAQHLVDERHGGTKIEASIFLSKHSAIIVDQLQSYGIDQSQLPPPPPLLANSPADDDSQRHRASETG